MDDPRSYMTNATELPKLKAMRRRAQELSSVPALGPQTELLRAAGEYVLNGTALAALVEGGFTDDV